MTAHTEAFITKVRRATADSRFEMCTDAFLPYSPAIDLILSDRVDYSQVVKVYSKPEEGRERYSPGDFVTLEKAAIIGNPNLGERVRRMSSGRTELCANGASG